LEESVFVAWSLGWFKLLSVLKDAPHLPRAIVGVGAGVRFRKPLMRLVIRSFQKDAAKLSEDFASWLFSAEEKSSPNFNAGWSFILRNRQDVRENLWEDLLFLQDVDLSGYLGNFNIPVLLISGTDDVVCPLDEAVELKRRLPEAELEFIEAGHVPFLTKRDEFNEITGKFLSRR